LQTIKFIIMTKHYGICAENFYFTKFDGTQYIKYRVGSVVPLNRFEFDSIKVSGKFEVEKTSHSSFAYSSDLTPRSICKLSKIVRKKCSPLGFIEEIYENN